MIRHLVTFTRNPGAAPETIIIDRARRLPLTRAGILRILREANPAAVFVSLAVVPLKVPRKKQKPRNPDGPRRKCLRVRPTVHLSLSRQAEAAGVAITIQLERLILAGERPATDSGDFWRSIPDGESHVTVEFIKDGMPELLVLTAVCKFDTFFAYYWPTGPSFSAVEFHPERYEGLKILTIKPANA